ncbi:hypothetical protein H5P28_11875 [Ruficoccus amylovorans]|uniref:Uncharacterized protein n=1 Tax=Ruficoccus amylovorans TaxID=1804625 RepID=A0A842HH56_9BACT|nr:hypothetical protein [Ruficoccus amylovorans]MBC2594956.1 hypothetical protein [Ruficoccus amylovorans]
MAITNASTEKWYASRIGPYLLLGNGILSNRYITTAAVGGVSVLGVGTPGDFYDKAVENFPPCTCFALTADRRILAAGNAAQPLRVWIGAQATDQHGLLFGVESLDTSYVDIVQTGATRITAISAMNDYYSVHTDAGVVDLFGFTNTNDGWTAIQRPSTANAGAINPHCVKDRDGFSSYYLGTDGELYRDEAVRTGPPEKRFAKQVDTATAHAAGQWNRDMDVELAATPATAHLFDIAYDRSRGLVYMLGRMPKRAQSEAGEDHESEIRMGLWCYNEQTKQVTGPMLCPNLRCMTLVGSIDTPNRYLVGLNSEGYLIYADLGLTDDISPETVEPIGTAIGGAYTNAEAVGGFNPTVVVGDGEFAINRRASGIDTWQLKLESYSQLKVVGLTERIIEGEFFRNASLSVLETPWLDLGAPSIRKMFRQIRLTFDRNPHVYAYASVRSDDGFERTIHRGLLYPNAQCVLSTNAGGKRIQLRLVLIGFLDKPFVLRSLSIGYVPARSVAR